MSAITKSATFALHFLNELSEASGLLVVAPTCR